MKAQNQIVASNPAGKQLGFSNIVNSAKMRDMIDKTFSDPKRAANFVGTLISVVNSNEKLKACSAESIVGAALKGEGQGLSLSLGQYSIVPYGNVAQYQISYKGLSQLAIRSGEYEDIGFYEVREGEYKGRDPKTRRPVIEWIEDEDLREQLPIVGFYGFYLLRSGFFKSIYWTHDKILEHANRYSKAFSLDTYKKLLAGELDAREAERLRNGSPWYGDPNSEPHMKMCRKTLTIQLLNDGFAPLSVEMQREIEADKVIEAGGLADAEYAISQTPEAVPAPDTAAIAAPAAEDAPAEAPQPKTAQRAKKEAPAPQKTAEPADDGYSDALAGFFEEME